MNPVGVTVEQASKRAEQLMLKILTPYQRKQWKRRGLVRFKSQYGSQFVLYKRRSPYLWEYKRINGKPMMRWFCVSMEPIRCTYVVGGWVSAHGKDTFPSLYLAVRFRERYFRDHASEKSWHPATKHWMGVDIRR